LDIHIAHIPVKHHRRVRYGGCASYPSGHGEVAHHFVLSYFHILVCFVFAWLPYADIALGESVDEKVVSGG
jgi:hypothetical protein